MTNDGEAYPEDHREWLRDHCQRKWRDGFTLQQIAASIGGTSHATARYWVAGGRTPRQHRERVNAK